MSQNSTNHPEIKFIWIQEYNNIKNLGVNFNHSGNNRFEYKDGKLLIEQKDEPIINFGKNISSVTAIAGRNGSGKSSLLEFILYNLATRKGKHFSQKTKTLASILCYSNIILAHNDLKLNNRQLEENGFTVKRYVNNPLEKIGSDDFLSHFIYYSNTFSWRNNFKLPNLTNISFYHGLSEQVKKLETDKNYPILKGYHYYQSLIIIEFLIDFYESLPKEDLQKHRHLEIFFKDHINFSIAVSHPENNYSFWDYNNEYTFLLNTINEKTDNNRYSLLNAIYKLNLTLANIDKKTEIEVIANFLIKNEGGKELFGKNHLKINSALKLFSIIARNNININETIDLKELKYLDLKIHDLINPIFLKNSKKNRDLIKQLIDVERELLDENIELVSHFGIVPEFSSGEMSLLSLFSKLFNKIREKIDEHSGITLLIDEGDLSFHPEWKRKYLQLLLDFLNTEFHNLPIQIILTTHSPYLLSDLPKENIILLNRDNKGNCKIEEHQTETLAANIQELLAEDFFLDGTIGEFAKSKIESLVSFLRFNENNSVDDWDKAKSKRFIKSIGDVLIKNKLEELYFEKFEESFDLEQQRIKLQKELDNINKLLDND